MPNPTATRWAVTTVMGVDVQDAAADAGYNARQLDGALQADCRPAVADVDVDVTYDLEVVPNDGEDLTALRQRIADHFDVPVAAVTHVG